MVERSLVETMPHLTTLIMFVSSYSPLLVILALRTYQDQFTIAVSLVLLAVLSIAGLQTVMRVSSGFEPVPLTVVSSRPRSGDALGYLVTYLVPFLAISVHGIAEWLSVGLLVVVAGYLYVHSGMFYVNPALSALRYHTFEVEVSDGRTLMLITRRRFVSPQSPIHAIKLTDYVSLEKSD